MRKKRAETASPVRFGTDGWRARIAEDFTFENVARAARATARYHLARRAKHPVVVDHDTRFLSREFAIVAAEAMAGEGLAVRLSSGAVPTPAVSHAVAHGDACGGVVITASHNPGAWNGFKVKTSDGSSAPEAVTHEIERLAAADRGPSAGRRRAVIRTQDVLSPYVATLRRSVDLGRARRTGVRVVADALHGASGSAMERLFAPLGKRATFVRTAPDPLFGGVNPEPIPPNVATMLDAAARSRASLAFSTDGDGDRIGAGTEDGVFVNSHEIFALVLLHLTEDQRLTGEVVKTVSTTILLDRICDAKGLRLVETPVGFKHIAERMRGGGVLIGGEESGGIAITRHLPERDGLYIGCTLLRMVLERGRSLGALRQDLFRRFGPVAYDRWDLHVDSALARQRTAQLAADPPSRLAGIAIDSVDARDGLKLKLAGGAWVMARASGTEPILRLYAEAETPKRVRALLSALRPLFAR